MDYKLLYGLDYYSITTYMHIYLYIYIDMDYITNPFPPITKPPLNNKQLPQIICFGKFRLVNLTFNWSPLENNLKNQGPFEGSTPLIIKTS